VAAAAVAAASLAGCGQGEVPEHVRHLEVSLGVEEDGALFFDWEGKGITEYEVAADGVVVWPGGAEAVGSFWRSDVRLTVRVEEARMEGETLRLAGSYRLNKGSAELTLLGTGKTRAEDVTYRIAGETPDTPFTWEGQLHAVFTNANPDQPATLEGGVRPVRPR